MYSTMYTISMQHGVVDDGMEVKGCKTKISLHVKPVKFNNMSRHTIQTILTIMAHHTCKFIPFDLYSLYDLNNKVIN